MDDLKYIVKRLNYIVCQRLQFPKQDSPVFCEYKEILGQ